MRWFEEQTHPDYGHSLMKENVYLLLGNTLSPTGEQIGVEGIEPPNGGTKNRCLTTWRHPSDLVFHLGRKRKQDYLIDLPNL